MRLSTKGADLLKGIEALRLRPYDDQTGLDTIAWVKGATIGYGHLVSEVEWKKYKYPRKISEAEAGALFEQDLQPFERTVATALKDYDIFQYQFDALVILAFNIGRTAFRRSSVLKMLKDPDTSTIYKTTEGAWKAWNRSQGQQNQGLVNRRAAEWHLFTTGEYKRW